MHELVPAYHFLRSLANCSTNGLDIDVCSVEKKFQENSVISFSIDLIHSQPHSHTKVYVG